MKTVDHSLPSPSVGTQRQLRSLHYGRDGGKHVYIQASLHADELPGMLVAHHLRKAFDALEAAGRITGRITLVPMANPIGLSQGLLHKPLGRFELLSGENFNRNYLQWFEAVKARIEGRLGADATTNVAVIRAALKAEIEALTPATELAGLRKTLMLLAHDADVVLDLHCDFEAVMHLYVETPGWPVIEPLARLLGAQAVLLNQQHSGHSFDEALGGPWWQLAEHFGEQFPIPTACADTTIELRGQADVSHELARSDATAIVGYLTHLGVIEGPPPELPPLLNPATPLAGSENLTAPCAGVIAYAKRPGDRVEKGDLICEIINPMTGEATPVRAGVSGVMYARSHLRYATLGMDLADVAGATPFRSGWLLSA